LALQLFREYGICPSGVEIVKVTNITIIMLLKVGTQICVSTISLIGNRLERGKFVNAGWVARIKL
jgi:hypothetical protein